MEKTLTLKLKHVSSWISWIHRYIVPAAAVIVIITNLLVLYVYCKQYRITRNETRKMSSLLYFSIASANIAAVIPKAMLYIYYYSIGKYAGYIPYHLCWLWNFCIKLPVIPHISTIWFVTILSLQRFMVIKHPFTSGKKWNVRNTVIIIFIIIIGSIIIQTPFIFGFKFLPHDMDSYNITNRTIVLTCDVYYADWLNGYGGEIEIVMLSMKILCVLLPSSFIIAFCDFSLIAFIRSSSKVRNILSNILHLETDNGYLKTKIQRKTQTLGCVIVKKCVKPRRLSTDARHQILLIVILSALVFIVHIPYGFIISTYIYYSLKGDYKPFEWQWLGPIRTIFDLSIVLTYPFVFILSCVLSKQFRHLLLSSFKQKPKKRSSTKSFSTRSSCTREV